MESKSIKYIVYCTTCIVNKKIYVGVHETYDAEQFDGYIGCGIYINLPSTYANPKTAFQYAVKKYGPKKFIRNVISVFDNAEDAYELEKTIVNEKFLARSDVYNMVLGGKSTHPYNSIKIYCYDKNGSFIREYNSILEASKTIGRDMHSLQTAIEDKTKCKDYFWTKQKFDKLDLSKMHLYTEYEQIPIYQFDKNGIYECCYDSMEMASKVTGINISSIRKATKLCMNCNKKYFTIVYAPTFSEAKSKQINSCKIYQYDLDGNFIKSYENILEAQKELSIRQNIYKAVKLDLCTDKYQWSFEKLAKMKKRRGKCIKCRRVGKYDKDWNLIKIYPTLAACQKENGSGMAHVVRGRDEFAKGFRYKFLD